MASERVDAIFEALGALTMAELAEFFRRYDGGPDGTAGVPAPRPGPRPSGSSYTVALKIRDGHTGRRV